MGEVTLNRNTSHMIQQIDYVMSLYWKLEIHTEMRNNTVKKNHFVEETRKKLQKDFSE